MAFDIPTKNKIKELIAMSARTVAMMCASGTLMQTFLATLGFDSSLIYMHSSLLHFANVLTMILCANCTEKRNPIKYSAVTALPTCLLFLFYIPFAISRQATLSAYALIVAVGLVQQISVGLYNVCQYKVPYYIYRPNEYGVMASLCGMVSMLLSLGIGSVISYLTTKYSFINIMGISFVVAAALMLIVFIATWMQKSLRPIEKDIERAKNSKKHTIFTLLKYPAFSCLIHANILRGFAMGITTVLATIAFDLGYTERVTTLMVTVSSLASCLSCGLLALIAKRIASQKTLFWGSITVALIPLMLIDNKLIFLTVYGIVLFGRTLVDYSTPAMLLKMIPVDIAGPYNAWRIVIQNAGTLIATSVAAFLPIPLLLVMAGVCQVLAGISFVLVNKKYSPTEEV